MRRAERILRQTIDHVAVGLRKSDTGLAWSTLEVSSWIQGASKKPNGAFGAPPASIRPEPLGERNGGGAAASGMDPKVL